MGLATNLGVDDDRSPLMVAAHRIWTRWCAADPELAVVEDLGDLPAWTRRATASTKGAVLSKLAALTASDEEAVTVLVWLLIPGATRIADNLRDLHPDIDGMVAGQLWIEAARAHELDAGKVAGKILGRTRREVGADLGVGDLARRHDRVWAEATRVEYDNTIGFAPESQDDAFWDLTGLMIEAMDVNAIHIFDAVLLGDLARVAAELNVGARRGRMGLTTPAVVDVVAECVHLSSRAIRRRASAALDRLAEYVSVRDDQAKFLVWRAQHPTCQVTAAEEMHLVINEDHDAHFFRIRDLPPGAWAPDVAANRRPGAAG